MSAHLIVKKALSFVCILLYKSWIALSHAHGPFISYQADYHNNCNYKEEAYS